MAVVVAGVTAYICRRPFDAAATTPGAAVWDLTKTRSAEAIGWPVRRGNASDRWTGHHPHLSLTHPTGKQMTFEDVDFELERERGQVTFIRLTMNHLTHA